MRLPLGVLLTASLLLPAASGAAPLRASTVRRFLESYGYSHVVNGSSVTLADGTTQSVLDVKTPSELLALTKKLERHPFAGLLGLRHDEPAMKTLLRNEKLLDGEAQVDDRWESAASMYAGLDAVGGNRGSRVAQLLQRKLARMPGSERGAARVAVRIAAARGERARLETLVDELLATGTGPGDEKHRISRVIAHKDATRGLVFARRALAAAPHDQNVESDLGAVELMAAVSDRFVDEKGEKRTRQEGIEIALARLRSAESHGAKPEHAMISQFVRPRVDDDTKIKSMLTEAASKFDANDLDGATRLANAALRRDPNESMAHHLLTLVARRRLRDKARDIFGDDARQPAVETPADGKRLVEQARAHGIEQLVTGFDQLTPPRQAVVSRALLPWRAQWAQLKEKGAEVSMLGLVEPITSVCPLIPFGSKTFDGREWYGVRGAAPGVTAIIGSEDLDEVVRGMAGDTVGHEFTHAVHASLPDDVRAKIDALYALALKEGRILDEYSRSNALEYLARGYEFWLADQGSFAGTKVKAQPPKALAKDRALYDFITELTGSSREER